MLLAVTAGASAAVVTGRDLLRKQAADATSRKLDGYRSAVEQYIDRAVEVLALSGGHLAPGPSANGPGLGHGETAAAVADGALHASPVFEYVMMLDPGGKAAFIRPGAGADVAPFTARRWFQQALGGSSAVGDLELSFVTRAPTVVVARPIRDETGIVVAVWAGGLRLSELSGIGAAAARAARDAHGYVVDRNGLVVAHQANPSYVANQTDFSTVPSVREALKGRTGVAFHWNPIERQRKVAAYSPLGNIGWAVVFASPESVALRPLTTMTDRAVASALAVGVLFATVAALVVRRALRPLTDLRDAAVVIGTGDLTARIDIGRRDEIGQVAEEMNRMASSLAVKEEAVNEQAAQLRAGVQDLLEAVAVRDLTVQELDAFSYSVSHDLRAPLRAISGFSAAVMETEGDQLSDQGRRDLERVVRAAQRMGTLIDDLLRLSRLSRTEMRIVRVDLSAMVEEIFAELAQRDPHRVVKCGVERGVVVSGDAGLVRVVLEQLIGNAWKFTAREPAAEIEVGRANESEPPEIFVRDNGAGFDAAYAHKLFGAFQRLHAPEEFPGTGIGLATVKRIVTRHGGAVRAEGAVGRGATFSFTLPERRGT